MTDRWEKESQKYAIHKIVLLCLYTYLLTIILLFSTIIIFSLVILSVLESWKKPTTLAVLSQIFVSRQTFGEVLETRVSLFPQLLHARINSGLKNPCTRLLQALGHLLEYLLSVPGEVGQRFQLFQPEYSSIA